VPELDVHLLMNHSIPGVNAGYITRNKLLSDHLRLQQEVISRRVFEAALPRVLDGENAQAHWLTPPSRHIIANLVESQRGRGWSS